MKNPCAKTVTPQNAYEVWRVDNHPEYGGTWTWYVLKTYQHPDNEECNDFARWLCNVVSPLTSERGETGDCYVTDIKSVARKLDFNPLVVKDKQTTGDSTN